ncbi:MAG: enoyl-CoA hydratase [Gammaproteobacteria bacterium]|nr:enoyl-CoA hydratase [Gammaproteobacteria bacterium]
MIAANQVNLGESVEYKHLSVKHEPEYQAVWSAFKYPGRPCVSLDMLRESKQAQKNIEQLARSGYEQGDDSRLLYQIFSSETPGVFSLGGDLNYFTQLIRAQDRERLFEYAKLCIDIAYPAATSYGVPFTTIALVQGEALGGGFEAALSANVLIAERSSKFGFPETVFGMFPGMGAFSFLARRLSPTMAKRIINSGKVYSAEELFDMGVVDELVPDGKGKQAVYEYIRHRQNRHLGYQGVDILADQFNPLTYKEMLDVIVLWVDTAMQLSDKNLRLMEYLVRAQNKRWTDVKQDELMTVAS